MTSIEDPVVEPAAAPLADDVRISATYSVDELLVLAGLLESEGLPGISDEVYEGLDEAAREAAAAAAARGLLARGALVLTEPGDGDEDPRLELQAPHAGVLSLAFSPSVVLSVFRWEQGELYTRRYYVDAEAGVEHYPDMGSVHLLELFPTYELLLRIAAAAGISQRTPSTGKPISSTVAAVRRLVESGEATEGLTDIGIGGPCFHLRCLYKDEGNVVGGEITIIDAGGQGLWSVEPSTSGIVTGNIEDAGGEVTLAPLAADAVMEELVSYLPGDEAGASSDAG